MVFDFILWRSCLFKTVAPPRVKTEKYTKIKPSIMGGPSYFWNLLQANQKLSMGCSWSLGHSLDTPDFVESKVEAEKCNLQNHYLKKRKQTNLINLNLDVTEIDFH